MTSEQSPEIRTICEKLRAIGKGDKLVYFKGRHFGCPHPVSLEVRRLIDEKRIVSVQRRLRMPLTPNGIGTFEYIAIGR